MPKRGDVISFNRFSKNASAIVDFVAKRARQNLQQTKAKRDQPSRLPAFDLQDFLRGPLARRFLGPAISARTWQTDLIENPPHHSVDNIGD